MWLVITVAAWSRRAALREAFAAVDGFVVPRLERNLRLLAAVRAGRRIHLSRAGGVTATATATAGVSAVAVTACRVAAASAAVPAVVAATRSPLCLACGPARRASLRFGEAALLIERLLAGCERER